MPSGFATSAAATKFLKRVIEPDNGMAAPRSGKSASLLRHAQILSRADRGGEAVTFYRVSLSGAKLQ